MGCLRPCGIQSAEQKSIQQIVEWGQKVEKVNKKVVEAKKFLKQLILKINHEIFDIIMSVWITPELVKKYIEEQEEAAREAERKRLEKLKEEGVADANQANKAAQIPKKKRK